MITGANLSEDYFTDRQDRCYIIQDCQPLADYFDDLISILTDVSFNLNDFGDLEMLPRYATPYKETKKFKNQMSHHLRYFRFSNRTHIMKGEDLAMDDFFQGKEEQINEEVELLEAPIQSREGPKRTTRSSENEDKNVLGNMFKPGQSRAFDKEEQLLIESGSLDMDDGYFMQRIEKNIKKSKESQKLEDLPSGPVYIFPTLQFPVTGLHEDEACFHSLLKHFTDPANNMSKLRMATGYLNLQKKFRDVLNEPGMPETDILTSSPRANSFYKAGRFKKHIPALYRLNAVELLKSNRKSGNINVYEYADGDWTFHAKGAWIYEKAEEGQEPLPAMTIIGSSNFSRRSNRLDTEAQLYIAPSPQCKEFPMRMKMECDHLFGHAEKMTAESLLDKENKQQRITWKDRLIKKLFGFAL